MMNRQLVHLSRIVIHPTYRGAGLGAAFLKTSCRHCPFPWIESLAEMGRIHPFFEKAGFRRVGSTKIKHSNRKKHSAIYGAPQKRGKRLVSEETFRKSRNANPVYYILDNRSSLEL
ncbi:hypothetical protein V22_43260 [Calycomorphotria hydatis]|uniref:N-acetyltransferase domain-containing protein n=2 Tax=Calycomorphotria hydatis TaxID=2528027 RepID=A0A517TFA6_9PLAN|nr:hypothetical protein V22_43260 [Calycomorphotria hydatis]